MCACWRERKSCGLGSVDVVVSPGASRPPGIDSQRAKFCGRVFTPDDERDSNATVPGRQVSAFHIHIAAQRFPHLSVGAGAETELVAGARAHAEKNRLAGCNR